MSVPSLRIDRQFFSAREEVFADIACTGFWPTTYISQPSPELPLHCHAHDIVGYLVKGETYILDGDGQRQTMTAGDRLVLPAGSVHAEGEVTEELVYIVTTERAEPFLSALLPLDAAHWPERVPAKMPSEVLAAFS